MKKRWERALLPDLEQGLLAVSGDFALGLAMPSGKTVLAVDWFAARSLCYRVQDGKLRFAERADTLADAETPIDPQAVFDYLYFHAIPSPRTIFQGVFRLPPGHVATFENGELRVRPYWTPIFSGAGPRRLSARCAMSFCPWWSVRWAASWTAASRPAF